VLSFNKYLNDNGIAYRLKQSKFAEQIIDVLVDFMYGIRGFAVECKSVDYYDGTKFYLSSRFGNGQIERINKFVTLSGRRGILLVELRMGKGNRNKVLYFNWGDVMNKVNGNEKTLELDINGSNVLNVINGTVEVWRLM